MGSRRARFGWAVAVVALIGMAGLTVFEVLRTSERGEVAADQPPMPSATAQDPPLAPGAPERQDVSRGVASTAMAPAAPVRNPDDIPPTPAGRRLREYLEAAGGDGTGDADEKAENALERLRGEGEAATELVLETYQALPKERYLARWMMVDTLGELTDHGALDSLREIAEEPLPPESPLEEHDHYASRPFDEEVKIRSAAVRGLTALAELGNQQAEQALLDLVSSTDPSVKRNAVLAYLGLGVDRRGRKAELLGVLAPSEQWMVDVPVISAENLPALSPPSLGTEVEPANADQAQTLPPRAHAEAEVGPTMALVEPEANGPMASQGAASP